MPDFLDRSILITGASGGLGSAVTSAFLEAGASVAGVARSWKERAPKHERFIAIEADLTSADGCRRAVDAALAAAGRLDALVHLMGGFAGGAPVQATDAEAWDRMMNVNAKPAFFLLKAALPHFLSRGYGRIVAVGSRAGDQPSPNLSAYGASKAALHALVRSVADEIRNSGVTANIIMPSTIDTADNRKAMPNADWSRWVRPDSIAALLVWLASEASADVNGALIPIYGRA